MQIETVLEKLDKIIAEEMRQIESGLIEHIDVAPPPDPWQRD